MLLHKYRGRGAYAGHSLDVDAHCAAGAAESYVRAAAKQYALDALRLSGAARLAEGQWQVSFVDAEGKTHQAEVRAAMSAPRQDSCREAPKPLPLYQVTGYSVAGA